MIMASRGTAKASLLFEKQAPPKRAIAAIGVKLGGWGTIRLIAARRIAMLMKINFGANVFADMFDLFLFQTNLHKRYRTAGNYCLRFSFSIFLTFSR